MKKPSDLSGLAQTCSTPEQALDWLEFAGSRVAVLREAQVEERLSLADAVEDLRAALGNSHGDEASSLPRVRLSAKRRGEAWMHTLRGRYEPWGVLGGKDYTSLGFETPSMWVTLADSRTGKLRAWIEADYLSRVRTAAVAALATDLLAGPEPTCLAHFGAGKISELLVRAVLLVRPSIRKVLLVRGDHGRGAPSWLDELGSEVDAQLVDAPTASARAEVITTATSSKTPVIPEGLSLPRLCHLNLMGSNHPKRREIGATLARRCWEGFLVADDPGQAALEAGDFAELEERESPNWEAVPSLAQVVREPALRERGRKAELTTLKSVGIGLNDVIVAAGVLRRWGALDFDSGE